MQTVLKHVLIIIIIIIIISIIIIIIIITRLKTHGKSFTEWKIASVEHYEGHSKSSATWHDNVKMSMHGMYQ